MLLAWLVFPIVLGLVCLGHGLLVQRASGGRLPGVLVLPLGLALLVVVSQLTTFSGTTAPLTTPVVVIVALAGIGLEMWTRRPSLPRWREILRGLDWWAATAAVGVFAVFGAPVVLSGEATFAGYTLLGDTSIHFVAIDHVMQHGRDLAGLRPSSYEFSLSAYFGTAYPLGIQAALGAIRPLVGQDIAWVYQPYLSFIAAMLALALYSLVSSLVTTKLLRALVAFLAAQPALVVAYALQGSIKEMGTIFAIALMGALVSPFFRAPLGLRSVIPLAVATGAAMGILNVAIAPWLGPILLLTLIVTLVRRPGGLWRLTLGQAILFAALAAIMSAPSLADLGKFAQGTTTVVTNQAELGNLIGPLSKWQAFGIWLQDDYRLPLTGSARDLSLFFIGIAIVTSTFGLIWALRRRSWAVLLFLAVSLIGWLYVTSRGSPWADGKALMIFSPAPVLAAALGLEAMLSRGRRLEVALLAATLSAGILWSNALAYHSVRLAPRDRLEELRSVGDRIAGQGPTLYTEFEEFAKHFLRRGDPEGIGEGWQRRLVPLRNGLYPHMGFNQDLDQLTLAYVDQYRTIVTRRSPAASRPPASFRLVSRGRYYELWQRPARGLRVREHFPLGNGIQSGGIPNCNELRRLAQRAKQRRARIAYVERAARSAIFPIRTPYPPTWIVDPTDPQSLRPTKPGRVEDSLVIHSAGTYTLWIQGSFSRGLQAFVDHRPVGKVEYEANGRGDYARIGEVRLKPGRHVITLKRGGGNLRPGNGGGWNLLGPVVLSNVSEDVAHVRFIRPSQSETLCGRRLDWVEIVEP